MVSTVQELEQEIKKVRKAQQEFAKFSQKQVDEIFKAAAIAANKQRLPLAKQAVAETGMGVVEDKVIKNNYAAEYIYNKYKNTKTCGVIEEDSAYGTKRIAEPIGVIAAVIPTTNPTSTVADYEKVSDFDFFKDEKRYYHKPSSQSKAMYY